MKKQTDNPISVPMSDAKKSLPAVRTVKSTGETMDLTTGVIWKKFLQFFFPIMIGLFVQQLYNTADAIIVGKYVGTDALAAVGGSACQVINVLLGFFLGIGSGATVVVSQRFGAGNDESLRKTVHTIVTFFSLTGIVLCLFGILMARTLLVFAKNPDSIMDASVAYLRIYFIGIIPAILFNVGSGILRAVGDSKRPLYYLAGCCVLNILLDILFVAVFRWGIEGAAWATVLSEAVSGVLIISTMMLTKENYRLNLKQLGIDGPSLRDILRIGIPSGIQSSMYNVSNFIVQFAVNELGVAVVAAWSAVGKFDGVFWVMSSAFGAALCAMVGQCFGAGRFRRMNDTVKTVTKISCVATIILCTLLLAFGREGMSIISDDQAVIDYSYEMLWYFVPYYLCAMINEILLSSLRGKGDSIIPTIICMISVCAIRFVWVYFVFPSWHTVMGISYCYPVTWVLSMIGLVVYYFVRGRKGRITKTPPIGKKILVLGCSGSGKSTFARELQKVRKLPLFHLDNLWWKPDRTHITRDEFDAKLSGILSKDKWIIDGDYSRTYEPRIQACDTIIFLDYSEDVCMRGIEERVGKKRSDIPWVEETLDPELIEMVQNYQTEQRPRLYELFNQYPEKQVLIFESRAAATEWLERQV